MVLYLLLLNLGRIGNEADVDLFHVGAAGARRGDAGRIGTVAAAEVWPALQLVKGLGVRAAAGTGIGAGGLSAVRRSGSGNGLGGLDGAGSHLEWEEGASNGLCG